MSATASSTFDALGDDRFVSLTTFRKSGVRVSTPVWIARDGDALVVITPEDTGKVKRLRNSGRVELSTSSRMGAVDDDAAVLRGEAELLPDSETARITRLFRRKYGVEFTIFMFVERLIARRQKKRVIVRILPA